MKAMRWMVGVLAVALVPATSSAQVRAEGDIVDVAVAAGQFETLATALQAAGLVDVLKGEGPFTVFAPTDEAFAKLPAGTVEGLLADREALVKVLTYHVVAGRVPASAAMRLSSAETVQGESIRIRTMSGKVMVDGATVVQADVMATNGVIHVIDEVILPPSFRSGMSEGR
jgi:uncharacterized surface protein with fasciclin (FAS1) repeats